MAHPVLTINEEAMEKSLKEHLFEKAQLFKDAEDYYILERFISLNGKEYKAAQFQGLRKQPKHCFQNALELSLSQPGLRYVEGMAHRIATVHHAWCVDADDNVVDPTWAKPEDALYCGIAFEPKEAACICYKNGYYGLFDGREGKAFILMRKLDPDFQFPRGIKEWIEREVAKETKGA